MASGKQIDQPHATKVTVLGRNPSTELQEVSLDANGALTTIDGHTVSAPLRTDPTGTTIQPVSGTITGTQSMRGSTTVPTAVSDGAAVVARADKYGNTISLLNAPRALVAASVVSNNSATSAASLIGAGAANVFNDIVTLIITNRSATATVVSLTDGTATYTFAIAANGGLVCNFPTPLPATSSATAWTIGNSAAVACDYVTVYVANK